SSKDSVEKSLSRTRNRIIGVLLGPLFAGIASTVFFCDAWTDSGKLEKIDAKLLDFKTIELDKNSSNYDKATFARDFQKQVYENIAEYTKTALTIKLLASIGWFVTSRGITIDENFQKHLSFQHLSLSTSGMWGL